MNHALYGAAIPFLLAGLVYVWRRGRAGLGFFVVTPLAMTFGALWASAPDLPRALGMHDLYMRLATDPRMDLFLWHYSIDQVETESSWYAVGLVFMAAALIAAALRELRREETG